ncbi:putative bifunctional diguanylate cyclase/phosphodiesterase [Arhodomonas sp. AD133]|uniref:putative bifunctional diguanylate cyclase/phosphodiesterase n=1 Tax=Arhodomonas sp. AD133 TaxID=3415009 RepID=UPI003EC1256E
MGVRVPRAVRGGGERVNVAAQPLRSVPRLLLDGNACVSAAFGPMPSALGPIRTGDCVDAWLVDADRPATPISQRLAGMRTGSAGLYMAVRPVQSPGRRYAARLVPFDGGRAVALELHAEPDGRREVMPVLEDRRDFMAALTDAARAGDEVVVGCVDVDRLRQINVGFGHVCGDAVLAEVGRRLMRLAGDSDAIASLGGDEFGVLLRGGDARERTDAFVQALRQAMETPIYHGDRELFVTVSAGFSSPSTPSTTRVDEPLQAAEQALTSARTRGRRGMVIGHAGDRGRETDALTMEVALRHALTNGEFSLCYQPVVALASGELRGLEALLRWHNPVFGAPPPDAFIPILEQTGLIHEVGEWVLRRSCEDVKRLRTPAGQEFGVAVNVSVVQLNEPGFADVVHRVLSASGLAPQRLTLEITEHLLMDRSSAVADALARLRAMGVRLAVDDFGTGYSSLAYLKRLPVQVLKVDRSFVQGLADGEVGRSIVRAILAMATSLGLEVVVEGVECGEEAAFFTEWPELLAQGYLFGRPQPLQALCEDSRLRLAG